MNLRIWKSIKQGFPDSQIHWLASPINQELVETVPYIDKHIIWNGFQIKGMLNLISQLRSEKYDLVIDFEQWARGTALLSFLSGAPARWGFNTPCQKKERLFTHSFQKNYENHEIFDFYNVIPKRFNLIRNTDLELWETDKGRSLIEFLVPQINKKENKLRILIHPGCGSDGLPREWPLPSYAVLAQWLLNKLNSTIFLTSGPEEKKKTQQLNQLINQKGIDLGGKLSWQSLISLVGKMDLIISGNTGIMHVAAALKKPQLALHGPTDPKLWGPLNPKAVIMQSNCPQCPTLKLGFEYHSVTQNCMKKIEISDVKGKIMEILRQNSLNPAGSEIRL